MVDGSPKELIEAPKKLSLVGAGMAEPPHPRKELGAGVGSGAGVGEVWGIGLGIGPGVGLAGRQELKKRVIIPANSTDKFCQRI